MAKSTLPVNFKDDVLASAMGGKRRYNMIQNNDGTVSFEDVTDYTQVGSTFGAAQINATNTAVNNAADASKIIDSLDTIKANTQSGYIAGALAVKELNSNLGSELTLTIIGGGYNDAGGYGKLELPNTHNFKTVVFSDYSTNGTVLSPPSIYIGDAKNNIVVGRSYDIENSSVLIEVNQWSASYKSTQITATFK